MHTARHTYATLCLSQGVSLKNVLKMLGHASVKMTERYARVLDSSIMRDMNSIRDALNLGNKQRIGLISRNLILNLINAYWRIIINRLS